MTRKDWVLLAISYAGDSHLSPAQLQKSLFLLRENKKSAIGKDFYKFTPYNYGPFCKDIYSDTESLEKDSLIRFSRSMGRSWGGYSLTEDGKKLIKELKNSAPKDGLKYLSEIVSWIKSISFKQLLIAIYKEYPKYRVNSIFSGA